MNVAHLITLTKRNNVILSDFCDKSTLFLCLCENFIIRCDRSSRTGGGVSVYVSNSVTFTQTP